MPEPKENPPWSGSRPLWLCLKIKEMHVLQKCEEKTHDMCKIKVAALHWMLTLNDVASKLNSERAYDSNVNFVFNTE